MPYIAQVDRPAFKPAIKEVLWLIQGEVGDDNPLIRNGEQVGYFIFTLVKKFLEKKSPYVGIEVPFDVVFNNLIGGKQESLMEKQVDEILARLTREFISDEPHDDLIRQGGEINFVCSSVCWAVVGVAGNYALRAFIKGCIWGVINMMKKMVVNWENDREYHMLYGVLTDVIDEMYRRRTVPYEDLKIAENGDI